ncbi:hypothetical protein BSKO_11840 [Bryopsis sp. KO-2023]|nr:hypothetical protein BSKO_11840 [Bryopsis sp. KO-2023]
MMAASSTAPASSEVQQTTTQACGELESAGRALRHATEAFRNNYVDVAVENNAVYRECHSKTVHMAGLVFRTSFPMSCAVVRDLSKFCSESSGVLYGEYFRRLGETLVTLDKLRNDVGLAFEISKLTAGKTKRLENDLLSNIARQQKIASDASQQADALRETSEGLERRKKCYNTGALAGGVVGVGGAFVAGCVGAPLITAGAVCYILADLGSECQQEAEVSRALECQARGRSAAANRVEQGMRDSLLRSALKLSSALDKISTMLISFRDYLTHWKNDSQKLDRVTQDQQIALYSLIQSWCKEILKSCTKFLADVQPAQSAQESLGTVEDSEVQALFQESNSEARHILLHMNPESLLETLQLPSLEIDGTLLTRALGPSQREDEHKELVGAGESLKNVISEAFHNRLPADFTASDAIRVFGVYHACVLRFTRALAERLQRHCKRFMKLRLDDISGLAALAADLGSYKKLLELGSDLHDFLADELRQSGAEQGGWEKLLLEVLEITSESLEKYTSNLEMIQQKARKLEKNPSNRRKRNYFDQVRDNALETRKSCVKYLRLFEDTYTGLPPEEFEEFAERVAGSWLFGQPQDTRVLIRSVATENAYRHVFERWVL